LPPSGSGVTIIDAMLTTNLLHALNVQLSMWQAMTGNSMASASADRYTAEPDNREG